MLIAIAPRKQPRQTISMPPPTVEAEEDLWVDTFDGSARVKRRCGACSAIVWRLPCWKIVAAASEFVSDLTFNEAQYRGLHLYFDLLTDRTRGRVVICGDSNVVSDQANACRD